MPELPEVETVRRGLERLVGHRLQKLTTRTPQLRMPLSKEELERALNQTVIAVTRRGKYIAIEFENGAMIIHLGMSGSLTFVAEVCSGIKAKGISAKNLKVEPKPGKHDHADFFFDNFILRYHDPRRFGLIVWSDNWTEHKLIKQIGPEPLSREFDPGYLFSLSRNKTVSVKDALLNGKLVAGIGNIYASEILFASRVRPDRGFGSLADKECAEIVKHTKLVLKRAIRAGGTTIRDYRNSGGGTGEYAGRLNVYGRAQCPACGTKITLIRQSGRSSYYCGKCQK